MSTNEKEPDGGRDNPASWDITSAFLDGFKDKSYRRWKALARETFDQLDRLGARQDFRIGQSMFHLILSLQDSHAPNDQPRVTLEFDSNRKTVRVCYSRNNMWFAPADSEATYPRKRAVAGVLAALAKLWSEMRPGEPLPHYLKPTPVKWYRRLW